MAKTAVMCVSLLNTKYSFERFSTGKNSVEIVSSNIKKHLSDAYTLNFIAGHALESTYKKSFFENVKTGMDLYSLLNTANQHFKDFENIIVIHTGHPFSIISEAPRLLKPHEENLADYTYCENYPVGMGLEIISKDTLAKLSMIASGNNRLFTTESIFELINFDINSYDIEVDIAPKDVRRDRLEVNTKNKRNFLIAHKIIGSLNNDDINFSKLYKTIKEKPGVMRSLPAYVEIEVSSSCCLDCIMCPRKKSGRDDVFMDFADYKKIIDDISENIEECHVCLSGMGEPFLHPDIIEMIGYAASKKGITLIVETSGMQLDKEVSDKLFKYKDNEVYVIFSIDACDEALYKKIRVGGDFSKVEKNIDYYMSNNKDRAFLQYVKMGVNEDKLDDFYLRWKNYEQRIIISKYNDFRKEMKKDASHNLSPIQRFPCWHLKRDIYITAECKAVFCKQDYKAEEKSLDVLELGVLGCFNKLEDIFVKEYNNFPLEYCKNCDEYFTYNF